MLNALIEDKLTIDKIISPQVLDKFKNNMISQGEAFNEFNGKIDFDKELDKIFDEKTKEHILGLHSSKI